MYPFVLLLLSATIIVEAFLQNGSLYISDSEKYVLVILMLKAAGKIHAGKLLTPYELRE